MEFINLFSSSPFYSLPVNSQLTTQMLLKLGYGVHYFEPIGLRKISLFKDYKKILERLFGKKLEGNPNLNVVKTKALPPALGWDFLQSTILEQQLNLEVNLHFIFLPSFAPIVDSLRGDIVYFVVDKYDENPNTDKIQVKNWEKIILDKAKIVITTSLSLFELYQKKHSKVLYWPNVCAIENYKRNAGEVYEKIKNLPGKKIITWGNITPYKMDFKLLQDLALKYNKDSFVLIGEKGIGEINAEFPEFPSNVHFFPKTNQDELLTIGKELSDVLILLNKSKGSGEFSFPMKLGEFMFCEKPIVCTKSPAIPAIQGIYYFDEPDALRKALQRKNQVYDLHEYSFEGRFQKLKKFMEGFHVL